MMGGAQIGNDAELSEALSLLPDKDPSSLLQLRLTLSTPSSPSSESSWVVRPRRKRVQFPTLRSVNLACAGAECIEGVGS
jgi:hypothetical protein